MSIKEWLKNTKLKVLDAQLILSFIIKKPKEWILAHDDFLLTESVLKRLEKLAKRRLNHEPMAYILGKKEFFRRNFSVTPDVLIPRPETEQIVEYCLKHPAKKILDVGTGSGCIAISLKLENPDFNITATDISGSALRVAKRNWKKLKQNNQKIKFIKADLLNDVAGQFDIIVANLPYVDRVWQTSPETKFEPQSAIFANDNGVQYIKELIDTAPQHLTKNGRLVLELDPRSVKNIKLHCASSYNIIHEAAFILVLQLAKVR